MSGRVATRSQSRVLQEVNNDQTTGISQNKRTKEQQSQKDQTARNVVVYYVQNGNEIVEHR